MLRVGHNKNSCYIFIANTANTLSLSLPLTLPLSHSLCTLLYCRSLALLRLCALHVAINGDSACLSFPVIAACSAAATAAALLQHCSAACGVYSCGECCKQTPKTALIWVIVLELVKGQVFRFVFSLCPLPGRLSNVATFSCGANTHSLEL